MRRTALFAVAVLLVTSALTLTRITAQSGSTPTPTPTASQTITPGSTNTLIPTRVRPTRTPTVTASPAGGQPTVDFAATTTAQDNPTITATTRPSVTRTPSRIPATAVPTLGISPTPQFYNALKQGITADGYPVLGDPAALFTLVEFTNFACPACAEYEIQTRDLITRYVATGKARYVVIPTVYGGASDPSYVAASAAYCSTRQNNFWAMRSALFNLARSDLGPRSFTPELMRDLAGTLGMNSTTLYNCVRSNEFRPQIQRATTFAAASDVVNVPRLLYSFDAGHTVAYFTSFNGLVSQRYEGIVPTSVIDQTLELANQAIAAARGGGTTGSATATPTAGGTTLKFVAWTSPDKALSGEVPSGWKVTPLPSLSPLTYSFVPSQNPSDVLLVTVSNISQLISRTATLPANPTAADVLRASVTSLSSNSITSSTIGSLDAASAEVRTSTVATKYYLALLSPKVAVVVAASATTKDWPTVSQGLERLRTTLQIDSAAAISILSKTTTVTPPRTPTPQRRGSVTPTPASGKGATPTPTGAAGNPFADLNLIPFMSPDGTVGFNYPDYWSLQAVDQLSPVAYSARAPNTTPADFTVYAVPISELAIRDVPANATPAQLLGLLYPDAPKSDIRSVSVSGLSGSVLKVTIAQQGSNSSVQRFDREVAILALPSQNVVIIQATTLSAWWPFLAPTFQSMRASVKLNTNMIVQALKQEFGPTATPTFAPTRIPTAAPSTGGDLDLASVGDSACVGVADPKDVKIPENAPKQFKQPDQVIDTSHRYCAILTTEKGRIVMQLYPKVAPKHVNSFVFLAQQGFYDNITWHRVVKDFVAQTGDPTGKGSGGSGYTLPIETVASVRYDRAGVVGAARSNTPNSASSQFFVTFGPQPSLNAGGSNGAGYTIFGQVVEGMDVVLKIAQGDKLVSVRIVDLGRKR